MLRQVPMNRKVLWEFLADYDKKSNEKWIEEIMACKACWTDPRNPERTTTDVVCMLDACYQIIDLLNGGVRYVREYKGLTQQAFAEHFGFPCKLVEDWESGANQIEPYALMLLGEAGGCLPAINFCRKSMPRKAGYSTVSRTLLWKYLADFDKKSNEEWIAEISPCAECWTDPHDPVRATKDINCIIDSCHQIIDLLNGGVRYIREHTGLTQQAFAADYGIPCKLMEDWESGAVKIEPYMLMLLGESAGCLSMIDFCRKPMLRRSQFTTLEEAEGLLENFRASKEDMFYADREAYGLWSLIYGPEGAKDGRINQVLLENCIDEAKVPARELVPSYDDRCSDEENQKRKGEYDAIFDEICRSIRDHLEQARK